MEKTDLALGLKDSTLTPAIYVPSKEIKKTKHLMLFANREPLISLGYADDKASKREAEMLIKSNEFYEIVTTVHNLDYCDFDIVKMDGCRFNWDDKEHCITRSEAGKVEVGNEEDDLVWIVFGENSLIFTTALCLSPEIQKIAGEALL